MSANRGSHKLAGVCGGAELGSVYLLPTLPEELSAAAALELRSGASLRPGPLPRNHPRADVL